jgi:hypothetical protein
MINTFTANYTKLPEVNTEESDLEECRTSYRMNE